MSLKNIEMQIAIPRTQEIGKIQSELNERANLISAQSSLAVQQEEERKRKTVTENEKSDSVVWQKNHENRNSVNTDNHFTKNENTVDEVTNHPFKRHFIDFNG